MAWHGLIKKQEPAKQQRLRYRLHYNLRKRGCTVDARKRFVIKACPEMDAKAEEYCNKLKGLGYGIQNPMFANF
jgi:hypothetical protein